MKESRHPLTIYFFKFVLLSTVFFPSLAKSQNNSLNFQHLTIENGLSDNAVNCITQDNEGYIWIGTEFGLNKYNAYSSKIFHPDKLDSDLNGTSRIICAFRDQKGRLWFGGNGLILCYPKEEKFIKYQFEKDNPNSLNHNDVFSIIEDEFNDIWIGTRLGLAKYNESTNSFTRFMHDTIGTATEVHGRNRIIDMFADSRGSLWMTTLMGIYQFSLKKHTFKEFLLNKKQRNSHNANQCTFMTLDKNGSIWVNFYAQGIYKLDTSTYQFTPLILPNIEFQNATKRIEFIRCDSKGNIWIASTFNGLLYFDAITKNWKQYKHDIYNSKSLADNKTTTFFEDYSGMLWIGTSSRGADRLSMRSEKFTKYILQPGKTNSLCENDITSACEDKNANLWIGSKNGIMYFNRAQNSFTCFKHDHKNVNSISDNYINSIAIDSLNNIWVATDYGVNYYKPKINKWKRYFYNESNPNSLPGRTAYGLTIRKNGEVWINTNSLVCRYQPSTDNFENRYNNNIIENLPHAFYSTIFEDSKNTMWLSTTRSGILNVNDSFHIIHAYINSSIFNANTVHQFAEDYLGNIWMASNKGLYYWKRSSATFHKLISNHDILNGEIKSVIIPNKETLWVSTLKGLVQIKLTNTNEVKQIKTFTIYDGLQSIAFNSSASLQLRSGELFFGGINGFNIFKQDSIFYNTYIPPILLSSFKVFNQEIKITRKDHIPTSITLNYKQNFFSFEMNALNYDSPEKNQYAYQLKGFDKEMNFAGTNRIAYYTNVPPGNYSLYITASNNDDLWNQAGTTINIIITPPFWQTNWFRAFMLFLVGLCAYLLYSFRIRHIKNLEKNKTEINKQIAEARLTALRAQMNPHFIFNSLNSIQQLISESEKENALKYLSKFSKLIRIVLQNSNKHSNFISNELNLLELYLELEVLRFSNRFTYQFKIDPEINIHTIEIPSMLIQPYVENAVVHGLLNKNNSGHLQIVLTKNENKIYCIIEDNGIGRAAASIINNKKKGRHESLGLQVTNDRVHMIEKISNKKVSVSITDLVDANGNGIGTKVTIEIPIEL
ncbi:MAG: histidine kinase [Saprospiraceae bacterium]|nr:histidine kinase [Saprospiraceae bacterium]